MTWLISIGLDLYQALGLTDYINVDEFDDLLYVLPSLIKDVATSYVEFGPCVDNHPIDDIVGFYLWGEEVYLEIKDQLVGAYIAFHALLTEYILENNLTFERIYSKIIKDHTAVLVHFQ